MIAINHLENSLSFLHWPNLCIFKLSGTVPSPKHVLAKHSFIKHPTVIVCDTYVDLYACVSKKKKKKKRLCYYCQY